MQRHSVKAEAFDSVALTEAKAAPMACRHLPAGGGAVRRSAAGSTGAVRRSVVGSKYELLIDIALSYRLC
jgi:hypothetical protein